MTSQYLVINVTEVKLAKEDKKSDGLFYLDRCLKSTAGNTHTWISSGSFIFEAWILSNGYSPILLNLLTQSPSLVRPNPFFPRTPTNFPVNRARREGGEKSAEAGGILAPNLWYSTQTSVLQALKRQGSLLAGGPFVSVLEALMSTIGCRITWDTWEYHFWHPGTNSCSEI